MWELTALKIYIHDSLRHGDQRISADPQLHFAMLYCCMWIERVQWASVQFQNLNGRLGPAFYMLKIQKVPIVEGGKPPSHTLPPLRRLTPWTPSHVRLPIEPTLFAFSKMAHGKALGESSLECQSPCCRLTNDQYDSLFWSPLSTNNKITIPTKFSRKTCDINKEDNTHYPDIEISSLAPCSITYQIQNTNLSLSGDSPLCSKIHTRFPSYLPSLEKFKIV